MIFNLPAALPDLLPSQLPPETDKVEFVENVFHARQKNSGSPSRISTSRLVLLAGERHTYSSLQTNQSVKNYSRVISTGTSPLPSPCPWTPASTYIPSPKVRVARAVLRQKISNYLRIPFRLHLEIHFDKLNFRRFLLTAPPAPPSPTHRALREGFRLTRQDQGKFSFCIANIF